MTVNDLVLFLEQFAPPTLAEGWDNVGLLVGDRQRPVKRVMTCLTITPASAAEAIDERADLVVTHHPLPFQAVKRITTDTPTGRMLWDLIGAGISVYSPHTAFDSAADGINAGIASRLELLEVQPLRCIGEANLGAGRCGRLPAAESLVELVERVKLALDLPLVQIVGDFGARVERVGIACGAAGEFLADVRAAGCQAFVTGETRFHTCLEAEALGIGLVLVGHYASERPGVAHLANVIGREFPGLQCWCSAQERDPLHWV